MEFIRYTSKSDIKCLKSHSMNLEEFIADTDSEKDTKEMYSEEDVFPKDWSSIYEVKITIEDSDITILNTTIPTILSMENVINDSI